MSSSSSSSFNDSWRDAVSRSKSRRSSSSAASSKSTTSTALQTKAKIADTTAAAAAADATAAPPSYATTSAKPTAPTTRHTQPQPNQRFSQYLARFNMSPRQAVAAAISSPRRGAKSLSNNVFFAIGSSSGSSSSRGGGGGSSSGGGGGGGDGGVNGDAGKAGGTRLPRRQRDRERKAKGSSPPPPPSLLPLTGPSALAATINSTLTVTTGRVAGERAAGESITTSDSSFTSDSLSGGGGGGGGGGDGGGFGVATGDAGDVTPPPGHSLPWEHPPASPPPACMPNLHQSSGSEGPSGSEDDEGFGLGGGSIEYRKFLLRRSTSSAGAKETASRVSTPGRRGLGTGSDNVEHKKFLLRRASSSAGENDTAGASSSPPGGGSAAGLPSTSASRQSANKCKGGLRSTGAAASAAAEAATTSSPTPSPGASLPPRAPRLAAVPGGANSRVQPSTAPPPPPAQPARKLTVGALAPAATPARSPTRGTPESFSASKLLRAKAAKEKEQQQQQDEEDDESRNFFRDPRLEATLALIRSGQAFCQERHIVVDFVRRAKPTTVGPGKAELQPMDDLTRHALLLTDVALYLLEVEMLPPVPPRSPSPGQGHPPSQAGSPDSTERGSFPRSPNVVGPGARGGGGNAAAVVEKAKVKSIKLMDRLQPSELLKVSLPFREVTLRNGDVVAKRGCGIVLHTSVEGREGNLWLKCRSNQDRGALVEALVPWFETNSPTRKELNVQQVPESPMARQLARLNAAGGSDVMRRKDTDCLIS